MTPSYVLADLRSDTLTRPTPAMREAMADAEVGDDVYGEDPTVRALEERVAALLGHEAAVFTPTGSMANVLGVALLVPPGTELLCDELAHVVRAELGAHAAVAGVTTRTWAAPRGLLDDAALDRALAMMRPDAGPYLVSTAAIAVEDTHNFGGGTAQPLPVLARLRAAHPGIRVVVRDAVARGVVALVKNGAVELGIGTEIEPDPEIAVTPLFEDRMVAVLPAGHRFEARRAVAVAELAGEALVLMDPESSVRALFDRACREAGVSPLPACEATYMSTAVALVRAGLGVGVLPSSAVDLRVAPVLQTRPIEGPEIRRAISVVRRAGRSLSPAAAALEERLLAGEGKEARPRPGRRRRAP